ncbi:hypothetical protein L227DRAFT_565717 [Lentinus tigrinus ALCF2SS1-6]|uniref:Uncharacterized protein n=1 Tax=Lentinus tigrinus ALCF2SS1-6 TaxID=1328759 RepID=A0A5C2S0S3_9APHY|nr:hypothetical protein L227DRAFT_565717 [Lentinus tigrinus ALCF2SS1-6]
MSLAPHRELRLVLCHGSRRNDRERNGHECAARDRRVAHKIRLADEQGGVHAEVLEAWKATGRERARERHPCLSRFRVELNAAVKRLEVSVESVKEAVERDLAPRELLKVLHAVRLLNVRDHAADLRMKISQDSKGPVSDTTRQRCTVIFCAANSRPVYRDSPPDVVPIATWPMSGGMHSDPVKEARTNRPGFPSGTPRLPVVGGEVHPEGAHVVDPPVRGLRRR